MLSCYLHSFIDANSHNHIIKKDDSKELQSKINELEQTIKEKDLEIAQLKEQLNAKNDDDNNKDANDNNNADDNQE